MSVSSSDVLFPPGTLLKRVAIKELSFVSLFIHSLVTTFNPPLTSFLQVFLNLVDPPYWYLPSTPCIPVWLSEILLNKITVLYFHISKPSQWMLMFQRYRSWLAEIHYIIVLSLPSWLPLLIVTTESMVCLSFSAPCFTSLSMLLYLDRIASRSLNSSTSSIFCPPNLVLHLVTLSLRTVLIVKIQQIEV